MTQKTITGYVAFKGGQAVKMGFDDDARLTDDTYDDPITIFSNINDANRITGSFISLQGDDPEDYEFRKVTLAISDEAIPIDTSNWDEE